MGGRIKGAMVTCLGIFNCMLTGWMDTHEVTSLSFIFKFTPQIFIQIPFL